MPTTAKIVADSISEAGVRLTTMVLEYPRIIHSEFMSHRMFSRNSSSSRAIPVEKQIERVNSEPFIPREWGSNKRGMQAGEPIEEWQIDSAIKTWKFAKDNMASAVGDLMYSNVHKQLANRLLEPFAHIQVIVTATEWEGFFQQRLHPDAQPEIQELAKVMKEAMENSTPNLLKAGEWHLPFISDKDLEEIDFQVEGWKSKLTLETAIKVSVARCARVSYGLNDRGWEDIEKDLALYDRLINSGHWSPTEHQAAPMFITNHISYMEIPEFDRAWNKGTTHMDVKGNMWSSNFRSWIQNRNLLQL